MNNIIACMRAPLKIPIDKAKSTPICINCKHYLSPTYKGIQSSNKKNGFCAKSGTIHVVDGTIDYQNVEIFREYDCKGNMYEEQSVVSSYQSMDYMSY
jgi:hypothetical protein